MVEDKVAEPLQPGQKNNKTKRKRKKKNSNSSKGPRRCFSLFALYGPSPESWSQEGMQEELVFTKQWPPPPPRPHHMRNEWAVMGIAQVLRVVIIFHGGIHITRRSSWCYWPPHISEEEESSDTVSHHSEGFQDLYAHEEERTSADWKWGLKMLVKKKGVG